MAHEAKDNKAHYSGQAKTTSTKKKKRPSKERGPYGTNTGTVQHRSETDTPKKK